MSRRNQRGRGGGGVLKVTASVERVGAGGEEELDSGTPTGGGGLQEALEDKSTWASCWKFQNGIFSARLSGFLTFSDTSWVVSVLCLFMRMPARMLGMFDCQFSFGNY